MEEWQREFEWLRIRHDLKNRFAKEELPEMDAVLFLVGIQELGQVKTDFTKEQKQDLMHIAICRLFEGDGFFEFKGMDEEGWPHYEQKMNIDLEGLATQENAIKERLIHYFADIITEETTDHE